MPHPPADFDDLVTAARSRHSGRVFTPGTHPPVRAGGTTCATPAEVFAAYRPGPQHGVTGEVWAVIGGFVRDCAAKASCESPATARTHMCYAAAFVAWCQANDVPLRAEVVFTPERVETYAFTELVGRPERSVSVIRGALRTIGLACTRKAAWSRPPMALRQNAYLAEPYTDEDVAGLWAAVDAQVRVVVLPDRLVPVRHEYVPVLDELCDAVPKGRLVRGRASEAMLLKDPLATYRRDLDLPTTLPALSLSRLRTTWAIAVLSVPVTLAEFHGMAGTTSAKSIEGYTRHIGSRDDAAWMRTAAGL